MADKQIALLLYGYAAELGNFRLFADDTATELKRLKKFATEDIVIKQTLDRASFVAALSGVPAGQKIKELHIYSHSIGGGLYVGYGEPGAAAVRERAMRAFLGTSSRIGYDQVLDTEVGGLLSDHLLRDQLKADRAVLRSKFAADATVKIWGCNSGVDGWVYSDFDSVTKTYVFDQNARADVYYWRALNTRNVPKPSIAQALADYLGMPVYGAGSGSHIEVQRQGKWITSDKYKAQTGRWPGAPQTLRLSPDRRTYGRFDPSGAP
jgi:hypothetical protein